MIPIYFKITEETDKAIKKYLVIYNTKNDPQLTRSNFIRMAITEKLNKENK